MGWSMIASFAVDQSLLQELFDKHTQRGQARDELIDELIMGDYFAQRMSDKMHGDALDPLDIHYAHNPDPDDGTAEHEVYTIIQTKWTFDYNYDYPMGCNPNYCVVDSDSALQTADELDAHFAGDPQMEWFAQWLRVTASLGDGITKYTMSC